MIYEITNSTNVSPLFGNWDETLIWSRLQGVKAKIVSRYVIKKEPGIFDKEKPEKAVVSIPGEYKIQVSPMSAERN